MTTVLTQTVARLLLAPSFVVAVAVLVKGYSEVGDGFSAGVIASLGVLLQYLAFGYHATQRLLPALRYAPVVAYAGLLVGLLVGFVPVLFGRPIFTHAPGPGAEVIHLGTLELLTAVAFDAGVFLLVFGFAVGALGLIARTRDEEES